MTDTHLSPLSGENEAPPPSPVPGAAAPAFTTRRLLIMAVVVSSVLLLVNGFVCATLGYFLGIAGWLRWQFFPGLFLLAFVGATILGFPYSKTLLRMIYAVSAAAVGALNFAFFAAVACWISLLPDGLAHGIVPRFDIALTIFSLALGVTVYGLINAAWLRTTRISVRLPNLPEAWQGRTIGLVTDIHLGRIAGPRFLGRIITRLRALQPDAVLISGDTFDGTTDGIGPLAHPWREYSAPRGVYYVTGNHEEFEDRTIYLGAIRQTGVRVLDSEKVDVHGLQIVGIHDAEARDPVGLGSILQRLQLDSQRPSILLSHQPSHLAVAEKAGVSLQLSGHTHRGQLWPWTLLVARIYGPFAYGLHRLGQMQVYTSSGAGAWGPPLRVGTKSEIVLFRLEGHGEPSAPG